MDELIRLCRKAANEWRNSDAYYQSAVLIDSLCDRLEKTTAKPKTNADRFRAMSNQEQPRCVMGFWEIEDFADWLKQPVKDGEG